MEIVRRVFSTLCGNVKENITNFRICKIINDRAYDLQDLTGNVGHAVIADIQLLMPAEYIVNLLPHTRTFGKACKYINDPSLMLDLNGSNPDQKHAEQSNGNLNNRI